MEEEGMRARSFRDEVYHNRRTFLRSYPLDWGGEEEEEESGGEHGESREEEEGEEVLSSKLSSLKGRFIAIIQWGEGKVLVLRKLKNKLAFYLVACHPFGFKSPNKMLTL